MERAAFEAPPHVFVTEEAGASDALRSRAEPGNELKFLAEFLRIQLRSFSFRLSPPITLAHTVGRFVHVPSQVNLTLVVRLVPSQQDRRFSDRALDVVWEVGDFGEVSCVQKCLERFEVDRELFTNGGQRRHVVIRRGRTACKRIAQRWVARFTASHSNVDIFIVSCRTMHGLPSDMRSANAWSPCKDRLDILS